MLGIFLVLLYLYINLTRLPLPEGGGKAAGIEAIFSIYGWGAERFDSPNSVAVGPEGDIYVSDTGNHRIVVFDQDGGFKSSIGEKAADPTDQPKKGPLLLPLGLAVADDGTLYVASMERSLVLVYDAGGRLKKQISVEKPIDLTIREDELFVSTAGPIFVYSLDGEKKQEWGGKGRRLGAFEYPNGLAHDDEGHLFVSDTQNSRIQILDDQGALIGSTGEPPDSLNDADRMFGLNMGLALDDSQRVYIVDAFRHSIHVFDHEGNKLGEFGEQGELEGRLNYPSGIVYLGGEKFAVADKWNDRIQVLRVRLPETEEATVPKTESLYPYLFLALLGLLLAFLFWRRWRLAKAAARRSREATV